MVSGELIAELIIVVVTVVNSYNSSSCNCSSCNCSSCSIVVVVLLLL